MKTILVTGGAGFIGCNFVRWLHQKEPDTRIIVLDALTYAGSRSNLDDLPFAEYNDGTLSKKKLYFIQGDITDDILLLDLFKRIKKFDLVINFAAESHVDRSILSAQPFLRTNILGTQSLLDISRRFEAGRFVQISTDEVYGSLGPEGLFTEETPLSPNSPYSASKAAADLLVRAAFHTFQQPVVITRCSNNYGPYQNPEKLIPLMLTRALDNESLPVYGDGKNVRDWIYVEDHCRGIWEAATQGRPGEVYNFGGNAERVNIDVVKQILQLSCKSEELIQFVKDRPGHDRRYAIDFSKSQKELGWEPTVSFEQGLEKTFNWYLQNRDWWEAALKRVKLEKR